MYTATPARSARRSAHGFPCLFIHRLTSTSATSTRSPAPYIRSRERLLHLLHPLLLSLSSSPMLWGLALHALTSCSCYYVDQRAPKLCAQHAIAIPRNKRSSPSHNPKRYLKPRFATPRYGHDRDRDHDPIHTRYRSPVASFASAHDLEYAETIIISH